MYIKVSSVCSVNPTRSCSCSCCAGNLGSCYSWCGASPLRALALNISGQKALIVCSLVSQCSTSSACWTRVQKKKKKKKGGVKLEFKLSPGLSLCCAALNEPGSHLLYFAVSWVAPFTVFKTGDVFVSLIWVPLTEITSSHVGTVCWLRVIPLCLLLFACDQGGKWTPATRCQ